MVWYMLNSVSELLLVNSEQKKRHSLYQNTSVHNPESSDVDLPMIHDVNSQRFFGSFAKLPKETVGVVMSLRLHGVTWLPLDGFS